MSDSAASPHLAPVGPPLVGRAREQAVLRACLAAALAGRGGLVLIGGEAGIGKTALAEALGREAARRGALVLVGRCYDLSETPPYGPWVEALAGYPPDDALPSAPAFLLDRAALAALGGQAALFSEMAAFCFAAAARCPLLLLLEDLHWADPASLDLLRALARQLAPHRLLLVATYRADELTRRHPLYPLLPLLAREARAARLDLRALDDAAVRALQAARYRLAAEDADRLAAYLREHAEGNPLYVGELLRALEEEGTLRADDAGWRLGDLAQVQIPPLLQQVIDGRVARLGEAAREALALAAVLGQEVPLALWAAVAGADEEALLAVVEPAAEARLLAMTADGAGVRFAHALIREALYEGVLPPRRRDWHRRAGEALAAAPRPDPDAVAHHYRQAGDPRAADWLVQAGERAQRAYALLAAAERYRAALALLDARGAPAGERGWLLYRLARMYRYADPRRGLAYMDDAAQAAAASGDRALAAIAQVDGGMQRILVGDVGGGLAALAAGVAAWEALDPAERARAQRHDTLSEAPDELPDVTDYRGTLVLWLAHVGRYAEALALGGRFLGPRAAPLNVAGAVGGSGEGDGCGGVGRALAMLGRPDEARQALARARDVYRAVQHYLTLGWAIAHELNEVALPYRPEHLAARRRLALEVERAHGRLGGAGAPLPPRFACLPLLLLEGSWREARAIALAVLAPEWSVSIRPFAQQALGVLARAQGEPELARAQVRAALPAGHRAGRHGVPGGAGAPAAGGGAGARRGRPPHRPRVAGGARPLAGLVGRGARPGRGGARLGRVPPSGWRWRPGASARRRGAGTRLRTPPAARAPRRPPRARRTRHPGGAA